MNARQPPVRSWTSRIIRRCSMRSALVSPVPISMVEVDSTPRLWAISMISSQRSPASLSGAMALRGRAGAQGVDDQLRELPLDSGEVLLVVLDAEVRVVAALEHDLGAAQLHRLGAAAQDVVQAADPHLVALGRGVERAELARRHARVGVVDV